MDKDLQTPSVTTWLLAAVPVICLAAYYNPAAEMAAGLIIMGGGSIGMYRIGRWAWARLMAGRGG
jgi:hypothetical protein